MQRTIVQKKNSMLKKHIGYSISSFPVRSLHSYKPKIKKIFVDFLNQTTE